MDAKALRREACTRYSAELNRLAETMDSKEFNRLYVRGRKGLEYISGRAAHALFARIVADVEKEAEQSV